jgi:hypothetical protein
VISEEFSELNNEELKDQKKDETDNNLISVPEMRFVELALFAVAPHQVDHESKYKKNNESYSPRGKHCANIPDKERCYFAAI